MKRQKYRRFKRSKELVQCAVRRALERYQEKRRLWDDKMIKNADLGKLPMDVSLQVRKVREKDDTCRRNI